MPRRRVGPALLAVAVVGLAFHGLTGRAAEPVAPEAAPASPPSSTEAAPGDASLEAAPSAATAEVTPVVVHVRLDAIIHPVAAEFVIDALHEADATGAAAFVLELSTPGGLLTSTREIFTAMLGARTPVVVYVAPSGAQAASAGFFLLMAADVAAMAPGTNTGAAHPVGGQGEDIEGTMGEKVEQDAAATIRSLAGQHGRNAEIAEAAVRESRSFTAQEALDAKLIEAIAPDVGRLLAEIDGRELAKLKGRAGKEGAPADAGLRVADARVREIEMTGSQRFRSLLAHPNVAYLLLSIGGLGIYFELSTPGAVLPGVIGAICLILGFYSLSILPVSAAGIALILLAIIFFVAEIKVTSYGLLTLGGVISLVIGSLMLFKSADPAIRVSLSLIAAVALTAIALVFFLGSLAVKAQRSKVTTGAEGLVGERGTARTDLSPRGKVFVHGEIWNAEAETPVGRGEPVEVVSVQGLELRVRVPGGEAS